MIVRSPIHQIVKSILSVDIQGYKKIGDIVMDLYIKFESMIVIFAQGCPEIDQPDPHMYVKSDGLPLKLQHGND